MTAADNDPIDAFDAALDAMSRGEQVSPLAADPTLLPAVAHLRDLDRSQPDDPRLAGRIWAEVMNEAGISRASRLTLAEPEAPVPLNGRTAPRSRRARLDNQTKIEKQPWFLPQLAVAAVLTLAIVGGLLALRFVRSGQGMRENVLDAAYQPAVETFVDATVENASAGWLPLSVERWTLQPGGARLMIPPLDGPQWIVAEGSGLVLSNGSTERVLSPGVGVMIAAGQDVDLTNSGDAMTSALRGVAAAGFALEDYDRALISKQTALDTEANEALPPGSSRIVFERLNLVSSTTLLLEPATGQDWLAVSSGDLGLTLLGDGLPLSWQSGREREVATGELLPSLVPGTRVTLRNIGNEPLVLLRLRVLPVDASESAGAISDAE